MQPIQSSWHNTYEVDHFKAFKGKDLMAAYSAKWDLFSQNEQ